MNIKLDHMNLTVRNLEESMTWYKNLFDMELKEGELTHPEEPWAIVGKDDTMICMYEETDLLPESYERKHSHHRIFHFGIRVSDREAWEKKIADHKIKVKYGGVYPYPNSFSWYITDPSGHEIEVSWSQHSELKFGHQMA